MGQASADRTEHELAVLALTDELMGARAEAARSRVHGEYAVSEASAEVDRLTLAIRGLQQEIARLTALLAAEQQRTAELAAGVHERDEAMASLRGSWSWRIGQHIVAPAAAARRLVRRRG